MKKALQRPQGRGTALRPLGLDRASTSQAEAQSRTDDTKTSSCKAGTSVNSQVRDNLEKVFTTPVRRVHLSDAANQASRDTGNGNTQHAGKEKQTVLKHQKRPSPFAADKRSTSENHTEARLSPAE